MAKKNSENQTWTDPKDYGLPYVEIKPLNELGKTAKVIVEKSPEKEGTKTAANLRAEVKEKLTLAAKQKILAEKSQEEAKVEKIEGQTDENLEQSKLESVDDIVPEKETTTPISNSSENSLKKKSNSWIVYAAIITLFLVATIVWQFMGERNDSALSSTTNGSQITENQTPDPSQEEINNTPIEEIQVVENQDSISNSSAESISIQESTETGTTIDRRDESSLIRIEGKEARPQYFIVVGSLPNENLAIRESAQYTNRAEELFLILPYDEVPHYRLAIGRFPSFTKANAELELIKGDYSEALWILKY